MVVWMYGCRVPVFPGRTKDQEPKTFPPVATAKRLALPEMNKNRKGLEFLIEQLQPISVWWGIVLASFVACEWLLFLRVKRPLRGCSDSRELARLTPLF